MKPRATLAVAITAFAALSFTATAWADEDYIQPTVHGPFPDGVNLAVPDRLRDSVLAQIGFVDVTAAPFQADATGRTDSTAALQRAIDFARDHQLVCFFPPGTYTVSDTLSCIQKLYRRSSGSVSGSPNFPCVLVGSRAGNERPRVVLAPRSPGFTDPSKPKILVHFWARGHNIAGEPKKGARLIGPDEEKAGINMNQMLVGLDLVIGEGNVGAIGVQHRGAQGSGVQDCVIDVTHGYAGILGSCASGGQHAGVTIRGGRIGLDLRDDDRPGPLVTGVTFTGQTESAIVFSGRQALTAVGLKINVPGAGPAIHGTSRPGAQGGQINLVDSEIVFNTPADGNTALVTNASLYAQNVFVRGARTVARFADGTVLAGAPDGWMRVREFAHGVPFKVKGFTCPMPIYLDGAKLGDVSTVEQGAEPPADLQERHLWPAPVPHWQTPGVVNVKSAPFLATGDGVADDTGALQRAIDASDMVFLPKGFYRISRTLHLRPNTKLFGVARMFSTIVATERASDFSDPRHPAPLVQTADEAQATTMLATLALFVPLELGDTTYALDWRSGGRSLVRDVNFVMRSKFGYGLAKKETTQSRYSVSNARVSGHGGGQWFNFFQENSSPQSPDFRHLLIDGARGPLSIYQCDPEHAVSEAQMEIRGSQFITLYGLKSESLSHRRTPVLLVRNSDHVRIFGYGGNMMPLANQALVTVSDTPNFIFANGMGSASAKPSNNRVSADWTDPAKWSMTSETLAGRITLTAPLERPVLFRRGTPRAAPTAPMK